MAYLTLNSSDFNSGLDAALERMRGMSVQSAVTAQAASMMGQSMDTLSRGGLARLNATMKSSITASAQMTAAIKTDYSGAANTVASRTSQLSKQIASSLGSVQSQARSAMVRAGEGMVAGLGSMQPAILAKARSIANNVAAAMRSALKIASPSKVTRQIGEQTGMGMALGISDMKSETEKRAKDVAFAAAKTMAGQTATGAFGDGSALVISPQSKTASQISEMALGMSWISSEAEKRTKALASSVASMADSTSDQSSGDGSRFGKMPQSKAAQQISEMALGVSWINSEAEKSARTAVLRTAMSMDGLAPAASFGAGLAQNTAAAVHSGNLDLLAKKLDTLIDRVSNSQQTLTVDGRSFARLLKEYS